MSDEIAKLLDLADGLYREGKFVQAMEIYQKLAQQNVATAQEKLGRGYIYGEGVEVDFNLSEEWLKKSSSRGIGKATYLLAMLYDPHSIWDDYRIESKRSRSEAVAKEKYEEAFKAFTKSAINGDAESMYLLAQCYQCGIGVNRDEEEFYKWSKQAFDNGFAFAANELLSLHLNMNGGRYDLEKAKFYFLEAKKKGVLCVEYPKEFESYL